MLKQLVETNYRNVRERIAAAALKSGRTADAVTLVAVTKYAQIEWVQALAALGATELGENRPQQLIERAMLINPSVHWHLIGPLQRNKARRVLPLVTLTHSVDSIRLLEALERLAEELNLRPRVLIEVNLSGEESKHGFREEELLQAWDSVLACNRVQVEGLMTMAAYSDNPEDARPTFARLRTLRDRLTVSSPQLKLPHLSMGMSGDFEVAIEEGATLVRVGSALWEGCGHN